MLCTMVLSGVICRLGLESIGILASSVKTTGIVGASAGQGSRFRSGLIAWN